MRVGANNAKTPDVTIDGHRKVTAAGAGAWGSAYAIATARRRDVAPHTGFRLGVLLVQDTTETVVESFLNLSIDPTNARFVATVLQNESQYVTASIVGSATTAPANTTTPSPKFGSGGGTSGGDGKPLKSKPPALRTHPT